MSATDALIDVTAESGGATARDREQDLDMGPPDPRSVALDESTSCSAAVYITLVEHPARMECGTDLAATEFRPSYRRAAVMQASLAVLGFVGSIAAWLAERNWGWLLGGVLLVAVVPFTLVVILPTNNQLLDPSLGRIRPSTAAFNALGTAACRAQHFEHAFARGLFVFDHPEINWAVLDSLGAEFADF